MKAVIVRHLNDIISLTVLALMAVALIAGQAEATVFGADEVVEHMIFRADIDVRLNIGELSKLYIEASFDRGQ